MSEIVQNTLRYTTSNTTRSDHSNSHNGQEDGTQSNGQPIIGFDCSGFVCHVMIESGYRINYEGTRGLKTSDAFTDVKTNDAVKPGDIILFTGHVGIVVEYNPETYVGRFYHMRGRNNDGFLKISDFKVPDERNRNIKLIEGYGVKREIVAFRRINSERYSAEVDLHLNGSNPQPTLRPLGTNVYSNYVMKKPDTTSNLAQKRKDLPNRKKTQYKSVPSRNGAYNLVKSIWGLPRGSVPDY